MLRICHVVPHVDQEASGPSYSVPSLCNALAARGHDVSLVTLARGATTLPEGYRHLQFPISGIPSRLGRSREMRQMLDTMGPELDILHSHSLWMMPNIYPGWTARRTGVPLVVSPRGTLGREPLSYSRWAKRGVWTLMQGAAVRRASLLHATSGQEEVEIQTFGLKQPITVIPNGVDIPTPLSRSRAPDRKRLLYLGRLHPKKGLDLLLKGWARLGAIFPDWDLRIVGPDEGPYADELRRLVGDMGLKNIEFAGPRFGKEKAEEYASADLFILPSRNENFGMSVAEALAHGTPVVASTETPWASLVREGCGWQADASIQGVTACLEEALACDGERLRAMGEAGRSWMLRDFSWASVAERMEASYRLLLENSAWAERDHVGACLRG